MPPTISSPDSVHRRRRGGFSLVELMVVVAVIGVLMAISAPSYRLAIEQSRADIASANLRAIWAAQRVYWIDKRVYAGDLATLRDSDLLDSSLISGTSSYEYTMASGSNYFTATARRTAGIFTGGTFSIDQTGVVAGTLTSGASTITPGLQ